MIDFYCECGEPMCANVKVSDAGKYTVLTTINAAAAIRWIGKHIVIAPCQKCLDAEYERGWKDGREEEQK